MKTVVKSIRELNELHLRRPTMHLYTTWLAATTQQESVFHKFHSLRERRQYNHSIVNDFLTAQHFVDKEVLSSQLKKSFIVFVFLYWRNNSCNKVRILFLANENVL